MFKINREIDRALTDQVCDGLIGLIGSELTDGQRLPSVRKLSTLLGVSLSTISIAYDRLISQRIVISRRGSGYFVSNTIRQPEELPNAVRPRIQPINAVSFVRNAIEPGSHAIPASSGFFPRPWMEEALPASVVGRLLRGGKSFSLPAPAQGLLELRWQLSVKLSTVGVSATPAQIITTFGATHAVQLICRHMLRPGDAVVIEDPSYMVQQAQLQDMGAKVLAVPRRSDGPDLEVLEQLVREHRPRLVFTQTVLHNPTGGTASPANCHGLLSLAEKYDFHLVEDDVFGDICTIPSLRLAAMDTFQRVFYVSSFTKVLSPSLRVGYMVCPFAHVDGLVDRKILDVLTGSSLQDLLVAQVLKSGRYHAHINNLQRRIGKAQLKAQSLLSELGIRFNSMATNGLFLWGELPAHIDIDHLLSDAFDQGILFIKGSLFSPTGSYVNYIRFNAAYATEPQLSTFLRKAIQSDK